MARRHVRNMPAMARLYNGSPPTVSRIVAAHRAGLAYSMLRPLTRRLNSAQVWVALVAAAGGTEERRIWGQRTICSKSDRWQISDRAHNLENFLAEFLRLRSISAFSMAITGRVLR
jgi:hypothetical protein